jgi:hypothetical protein
MLTIMQDAKAKELGCTMIVLDAFTGNYTAHRLLQLAVYSKRISLS